jgi:hypothetical protein
LPLVNSTLAPEARFFGASRCPPGRAVAVVAILIILVAAFAYYGSYWKYWFNPHDEGGRVPDRPTGS